MPDQPRTDQEQWAADLLRLLGFNVKMNYWPTHTPRKIEIDVWGRLGPLQVAVECKKYSRDAVGASDIEYFHEKLEMLGKTLGIFVANSYSEHDLMLCRRFGILPLTSQTVRAEITRLEQTGKKYLVVSTRTWQVQTALMRFVQDWEGYFDPDWPFQSEVYATEAFEQHGLIQTQRSNFGDFQYKHTETGKAFFGHLRDLRELFEYEGVTAMNRLNEAALLVTEACGVNSSPNSLQGYDSLIIQGLGLRDIRGKPTRFGTLLASVIEDAVLRSNASW